MNRNNKKGSALVETAIILPILLVIVFGILEFGWMMYKTNTLNNAAREGARRAAVTPKPIIAINIEDYVKNFIIFSYEASDLTITTVPTVPASGDPVKVSVTLIYRELTPIISLLDLIFSGTTLSLDGKKLTGEATMRYEL